MHAGRYLRQGSRGAPLRVGVGVAAVVVVGSVASALPSGATASRPGRGGPVGVAAGTFAFNINSNLHLIGRPGHILNEKGTFTGSQSGTISIRFTKVSSTSGSATFAAYSSHGGSVSGSASTKGHVVGANIYFTGVLAVTGGTGRWAHASGSGLKFDGVVDRQDFHATTHIQGSFHV